MKKVKERNLTILAGNLPVAFTVVSLTAALAVSAIIVYLLSTDRVHTAEVQFAMIFSALLVLFALVVSYVLLKARTSAIDLVKNLKALKDALDTTEDLNDTLRGQRHDFLNHIQIIHGLLEMEEYSEAADYMKEIYSEIQAVTKILKTSSPAINALLQVKNNSCDLRGLDFEIVSTTRLENPAMESWDICAILGNLIDNAIKAVENKNGGIISVSLSEDINGYVFRVRDNGNGIPEEVRNRIFEMGVSTKEGEGHGIGLALSRKKLKAVGGDICFESEKGSTEFAFTIPRAIQ